MLATTQITLGTTYQQSKSQRNPPYNTESTSTVAQVAQTMSDKLKNESRLNIDQLCVSSFVTLNFLHLTH